MNDSLLTDIKDKIAAAGEDLRANRLPRLTVLVLDVRRLRPGRPVQDAPVRAIDRLIEQRSYFERVSQFVMIASAVPFTATPA